MDIIYTCFVTAPAESDVIYEDDLSSEPFATSASSRWDLDYYSAILQENYETYQDVIDEMG